MTNNHSVDDLLVTNRQSAMDELGSLFYDKKRHTSDAVPVSMTADLKLDELLRITNRISRSFFINPGKWMKHRITKLKRKH